VRGSQRPSLGVTLIALVSGLVGTIIGAAILLTPVEFHAAAGIVVGESASLRNEMRASGGALLASGLFVVVGAFRGDLTFAAVLLAAMTYLAFGLSRAFSIVVDGVPDEMLVIVAALEIAWGLVCASAVSGRLRKPVVQAGEGLPVSA